MIVEDKTSWSFFSVTFTDFDSVGGDGIAARYFIVNLFSRHRRPTITNRVSILSVSVSDVHDKFTDICQTPVLSV